MKYSIEDIIDLAGEVELGDSIDWDNVHVDRDKVYQIIASQVCEMHESWDDDMKEVIMLATITKLVVENYVLNLKVVSNGL